MYKIPPLMFINTIFNLVNIKYIYNTHQTICCNVELYFKINVFNHYKFS